MGPLTYQDLCNLGIMLHQYNFILSTGYLIFLSTSVRSGLSTVVVSVSVVSNFGCGALKMSMRGFPGLLSKTVILLNTVLRTHTDRINYDFIRRVSIFIVMRLYKETLQKGGPRSNFCPSSGPRCKNVSEP